MKRRFSIILAILLVFGSVSSGFAASGGGNFDADEFVKVKATGSVPDSSAGIAFDVEGEYTNNGINYDFYLTLPPGAEELEVTIVGYPEEVGVTPASVDYQLNDEPYTGIIEQEKSIMIDLEDFPCEEGDVEITIDIKWFPPSGSSQEVMHGTLHVTCTPESFDLDVSIEGEGTTNPVEGTHTYEEGTVVDLEADPATGWYFVEWQGPVASNGSSQTTVLMDEDKEVEAVFDMIDYTLTVTHIGQGTTTPSGASTVHFGDEIGLTAVPAQGWMFSHWTGPVASPGSASTVVFIEGNTNVEAVFIEIPPNMVSLTVTHIGQGSTNPSGTDTVTEGTVVDLVAVPASGWHFVEWLGPVESANTATSSITVLESTTATAVFEPDQVERYTLYIAVDGNGTTTPIPGSHSYEPGEIVNLNAIPGSGWYFVDWVGIHGSVVSNGTIEMNGDRWITALFNEEEMEMVTLTVNIQGNGITDPDEGDHDYPIGEEPVVVDLYTSADPGWYFDGWIGDVDNDQVVMDDDKEITAVFKKYSSPPPPIIRNRLSISIEGNGSVDPFVGSQNYLPGTIVDVGADPGTGWVFEGWIGPDGGDVSGGQIQMDDDKTIIAKFVQAPPPPPIEPPEIIIPLTEAPLSDGDLPNTGQAIPWLTLILGFGMVTFGYFFKKEIE